MSNVERRTRHDELASQHYKLNERNVDNEYSFDIRRSTFGK